MLVNDISIVKNINVLSRFKFSSDHRIVRGTLIIPRRVRIKKLIKNKSTGRVTIPPDKKEIAKEELEQKIKNLEIRREVQTVYNNLEAIINEIISKYGKKKQGIYELKTN